MSTKRAGDQTDSLASAAALWRKLLLFGRNGDFIYANWLWRIRRLIDWCLGGTAMRRRRRHPAKLRVGDVFAGWRVIGLTPKERLTLLMETRAPGAGVLEFEIVRRGIGNRIRATAYWHPAGIWGLLYWYALWPFHNLLFAGLAKAIARRAEQSQQRGGMDNT